MRQLLVGTAIILALASLAPASAQVPRRGVPGAQPPAATAPIPPPLAPTTPPAAQPAPAPQANTPAPAVVAPQPAAVTPMPTTTARLPGAAAAEATPARPRPRRDRPVRATPEAAPAVREAAPAVSRRSRSSADYIASQLNRRELDRLPSGGGMPPNPGMTPAESPAAGDPPYPWRGYGAAGAW